MWNLSYHQLPGIAVKTKWNIIGLECSLRNQTISAIGFCSKIAMPSRKICALNLSSRRGGLDPKDKKKYRKYSLGMKQRPGIANAIMEGCDLIVLDEPTNALDSDGVEMLKQIVREEKARGATILISCHDAQILQELSDEIFRLREGCVISD